MFRKKHSMPPGNVHRRRVHHQAEVVRHPGRDPKNNPRFVVTQPASQPVKRLSDFTAIGETPRIGSRELHHGPPDRPDELLELLGQPVSCPLDCRRLCSHAGNASAGSGNDLESSANQAHCASGF